MSRYIDADALIADFYTVNPQYKQQIEWAERIINAAPTIDIVRCKECKWNRTCLNPYSENDDGFCSYGERAEQTEPITNCDIDCSWK